MWRVYYKRYPKWFKAHYKDSDDPVKRAAYYEVKMQQFPYWVRRKYVDEVAEELNYTYYTSLRDEGRVHYLVDEQGEIKFISTVYEEMKLWLYEKYLREGNVRKN